MTLETETIDAPILKPRRPKKGRCAITNGRRLLMADGRSPWARRFRDIVALHCADLGGYQNLSQAQMAIIRRCATLQIELESQEARLASGDTKGFSLTEFAQVSNGLRRMLETIGLSRVARDVTPSLTDLVMAHHADAEMVEARAEQERVDEMVEEGRDTETEELREYEEGEGVK
jgi:hypothetical protein